MATTLLIYSGNAKVVSTTNHGEQEDCARENVLNITFRDLFVSLLECYEDTASRAWILVKVVAVVAKKLPSADGFNLFIPRKGWRERGRGREHSVHAGVKVGSSDTNLAAMHCCLSAPTFTFRIWLTATCSASSTFAWAVKTCPPSRS